MDLELPTHWVHGEKVPFSEGNNVEFKEVAIFSGLFKHRSSKVSGLPKYRDTLIGFLNGGGGYLIMGIRDDRTIVGVNDMTDEDFDKLKLWVDSTFNILVHKNGQPLDPSRAKLLVTAFPVENAPSICHVVLIKVTYTGEKADIMTRGGTMVYRLNASNYKISSEPVYRSRDVRGMIQSVQSQMQIIINDKHKALKLLQEKHKQEIDSLIKTEKDKMCAMMTQVSDSLYTIYRPSKKGLCERLMKYFTGN